MLVSIDNLTRSDKLFYAGIAMMILSVILLVIFLMIFHIRSEKLNRKLDEEYGKDLDSGKQKKNS